MKKLLISLSALGILFPAFVSAGFWDNISGFLFPPKIQEVQEESVLGAVTSTRVTNLIINNLSSTGNPCLIIGSTGLVATSTCGGSGGGSGISTSSLGSYTPGNVFFVINSSTASASNGLQFSSSTGNLEISGSIGIPDTGNFCQNGLSTCTVGFGLFSGFSPNPSDSFVEVFSSSTDIGFGIISNAGPNMLFGLKDLTQDVLLEAPNFSGTFALGNGTNSIASWNTSGVLQTTTLIGATFSGNTLTITAPSTTIATKLSQLTNDPGFSSSTASLSTSTPLITNTLPITTAYNTLGNSVISQNGTSTTIAASSTTFGVGTSTLEWVTNNSGGGYWNATGTRPVVSSCGTSPTSTGNQWRGRVTAGGSATSCTLTFPITFLATPSCIVTEETASVVNALSYTANTTTLVVSQTALGGNVFNYDCVGQE